MDPNDPRRGILLLRRARLALLAPNQLDLRLADVRAAHSRLRLRADYHQVALDAAARDGSFAEQLESALAALQSEDEQIRFACWVLAITPGYEARAVLDQLRERFPLNTVLGQLLGIRLLNRAMIARPDPVYRRTILQELADGPSTWWQQRADTEVKSRQAVHELMQVSSQAEFTAWGDAHPVTGSQGPMMVLATQFGWSLQANAANQTTADALALWRKTIKLLLISCRCQRLRQLTVVPMCAGAGTSERVPRLIRSLN